MNYKQRIGSIENINDLKQCHDEIIVKLASRLFLKNDIDPDQLTNLTTGIRKPGGMEELVEKLRNYSFTKKFINKSEEEVAKTESANVDSERKIKFTNSRVEEIYKEIKIQTTLTET